MSRDHVHHMPGGSEFSLLEVDDTKFEIYIIGKTMKISIFRYTSYKF